jgi:hypothetical protein
MKIKPEYTGVWRIKEMSTWDRDFIDLVAPDIYLSNETEPGLSRLEQSRRKSTAGLKGMQIRKCWHSLLPDGTKAMK